MSVIRLENVTKKYEDSMIFRDNYFRVVERGVSGRSVGKIMAGMCRSRLKERFGSFAA